MKLFFSSVTGATILISVLNVISKGSGFFRDIIFASIFGLSLSFDIYLVAAVIPLTINVVILTLGQNYLIPTMNKVKLINPGNFILITRGNFTLFILLGFLISVILFLFSDHIFSNYFGIQEINSKQTISTIFNLLLISIPFNCAISVLTAYQQCNFEFRYSTFAQLFPNISIITLLLCFNNYKIYSVPIGYTLGIIIQFAFLMVKSKEIVYLIFTNVFSFKNFKEFSAFNLFIIVLIEIIGQLYVIADRIFYQEIETGGISAITYAQIIFILPLNIFSIALSTAIFPRFSDFISSKNFEKLQSYLNTSISFSVIFFTPIMIIFLVYGEMIIRLVYERGNFTPENTITTGQTLYYFSYSLVIYSVYAILNKLLYSAGLFKHLLIITLIGIGIKIMINYFLVKNMEQYGLALGTTISYAFFFIASLFIIFSHFKMISKTILLNELIFNLLNGAFCYLVIHFLSQLFPITDTYRIIEISLFLIIFGLNNFYLNINLRQLVKQIITKIFFTKRLLLEP